jgi:sterol desaturase/sphingolipid hydroxylase (fatty acid hydroxylase superfamily)
MSWLKFRYYTDFIIPPAAIAAVACSAWESVSATWLPLILLGLLLFTFIEYWTHRTLLHRVMWHGAHQRHHTHPHEFTIFPWWYLPAIFAGFWFILPSAVYIGFMLGAMWFFIWHHMIHHWSLQNRPWLQAYERWHNLHHRDLPVNYGITQPLWDIVFGTYLSPKGQRWSRT